MRCGEPSDLWNLNKCHRCCLDSRGNMTARAVLENDRGFCVKVMRCPRCGMSKIGLSQHRARKPSCWVAVKEGYDDVIMCYLRDSLASGYAVKQLDRDLMLRLV